MNEIDYEKFLTPEEEYKNGLKEALLNLIKVNESIIESMVPILVNGELNEWNQSVPIGELHQFNYEIFRNSEDASIKLLVDLIEEVDRTFHSIKNINGIEMEGY